jgi:hypothetical protein
VAVPNRTSFTSESGKKARGTGPLPPAKTRVTDLPTREYRGQKMLEARSAGLSVAETAKTVGLSPRQTEKELRWMRQTGRITKYEGKLVGLAPEAIRVATAALLRDDTKAAIEILKMLLRLGDRAEARSSKEVERGAALDDYLTKLKMQAGYDAAAAQGPITEPVAELDAIDAEVVEPDPSTDPTPAP